MKIKTLEYIDVRILSKADKAELVRIIEAVKSKWIPACHNKGKLEPECKDCPWREK